jgi:hypothetical protein
MFSCWKIGHNYEYHVALVTGQCPAESDAVLASPEGRQRSKSANLSGQNARRQPAAPRGVVLQPLATGFCARPFIRPSKTSSVSCGRRWSPHKKAATAVDFATASVCRTLDSICVFTFSTTLVSVRSDSCAVIGWDLFGRYIDVSLSLFLWWFLIWLNCQLSALRQLGIRRALMN